MKLSSPALCRILMVVAFFCVVSQTLAQEQKTDSKTAVAFLTDGVDSIPVCGVPGPLATFGDSAFPVVLGKYENSTVAPVVSAAFVGRGRTLAFGHTDYCSVNAISASDSSLRFFQNALLWASGKTTANFSDIRVAVWRDQATADFLKREGFDAFAVNDMPQNFDVLVAGSISLNDKQYDALFNEVHRGAGYITCGLGWGWSQLNPGKDLLRDHSGNRNLLKNGVGIAWAGGTLGSTLQGAFEVSADAIDDAPFANGAMAFDYLRNLAKDPNAVDEVLSKAEKDDLRQISATFALAFPYLSKEQIASIDKFVSSFPEEIVPTEKNPVSSDDLLKRLAITIQTQRYLHGQTSGVTAPEDVPAFAAAREFPGEVPQQAERLNDVSVLVKTSVPDWTSTGLYAAPGEVVTIKIAPELFAKLPRPFRVRVGCHSDNITRLQRWARYPEITLEKAIDSPETKIVNPFGGLVYIVVPRGISSAGLGQIEFKISGAVAAPYFVRDVTSLDAWKSIRENPAPWAELQGRNVIVSVPSKVVREIDNPQQLLETWDEILDLIAEFASGPYVRVRPERITCDRQISAGYMHSGYPVMTHMDVEKTLVDNERLRKEGDWGFYHEFGHNHQSSHWTFDGTVEVTVNYFTLYVMEKLNGRRADVSKGDLTKAAQERMIKRYFGNGAKFEDWKSDPFLALTMSIQMREKFGWEPFLRSISEYRKASPSELPKNDQEKRDQWMTRLSNNSGLNLGPFFTLWGVPISQDALDAVADMPEWIPDELKEYVR
ncbi:MAG: M60 family metallopeptidase [Thermoguttaceae bacterium]|jgi:hypothetical protein